MLPDFLALPTTFSGILLMLFSIWMIVDCIRTDNSPFWIALIFFSVGFGSLLYFASYVLPRWELGRRWHARFAGRRHIDELRVKIRDIDGAWHWEQLGHEYRKQQRWAEAADAYRHALERDRTADGAQYGLGLASLALGDGHAALDLLLPLVATNPRYDWGGAGLAVARAWRAVGGRTEEALEAYRALLEHFGYSEVRYEYAELLHEAGRREEARRMMQRIVEDAAWARGFNRARERRWGRRAKLFLKLHPEAKAEHATARVG